MTASVAAERVAGLDARLPGLDGLFDCRRSAALFARTWRTDVLDCTLLGVRYDPGAGCVATYALATAATPHTIGVVEVTPDERRVASFVDDPEMPGLAEAADGGRVARLLADALGGCRVTVVPVRYRPGQRAVLRYDVDTETGQLVFFGKVLRAGVSAVAAAFARLHQQAESGTGPYVPAPTAVNERMGLLVLPSIEGRSLHGLAFDDSLPIGQRADAFRDAGRAVAGLHGGAPPSAGVTWAGDVAGVERSAGALRAIDPRLAERWSAVVGQVAGMAVGDGPCVPGHGALRTDQVILSPDGPALLDLDGFCAALRARDLGNLLAYLRWRAMRRPEDGAVVAAGRDALLAGYGEVAPVPARDLARHESLSLLKIAGRRYRNLDVAEWHLVPHLVEVAASCSTAAS